MAHLGKARADDEPLELLTVLDSNGLDDALWVLSYAMPNDRLARHFQAWCAEQVMHIFEAERPNDRRVREQIAMLRNDDATPIARAFAGAAAARAAAIAFARAAASVTARDAANAAARDAARDAANAAASAATRDAARDAANAAAWAAARAAARDAASVTASDAQEKQLRKMLGETE